MLKLVTLGAGSVGKSALTMQFIQNHFVTTYDPTVEDSYRKQVEVDYQPVILDILDTAGQEEFVALRNSYIRTGQGFVCVYSIANSFSFDTVKEIYEEILRVKNQDSFPMIFVGNKSDLESERQISTEAGKAFADSVHAPFFETSAKTGQNVETAYFQLVREVRKYLTTQPDTLQQLTPKKTGGKKPSCLLL
jgi:GTPase KRas